MQFFLGDPQGYKGPEIRYAGGADGLRAGRRGGRRRPLRARALHRERRDHQQPHPDPEPQAAPAAHGRRGRDRRQGPDRPRRPRQQGRRPGQGLRQLAQGGRGHRHQDPAADREHRRRRQRDGPPPRPDRRRVGRDLRGRGLRPGRLLPRHLPRLGRRHRAGHRRGEGPRDHRPDRPRCTPTTAATPSTPAPTGTPTSATASSTRTTSRAWSATPAPRSSARRPAAPPSTRRTSRGCASTASDAGRPPADCAALAPRAAAALLAGCGDDADADATARPAPSEPADPLRRRPRSQFADLRMPDAATPLGTVVLLHGGYWQRGYGLEPDGPARRAARPTSGFATWNVEYRRDRQRRRRTRTRSPTSRRAIDRLGGDGPARRARRPRRARSVTRPAATSRPGPPRAPTATPGGAPHGRGHGGAISLAGLLDLTRARRRPALASAPVDDVHGRQPRRRARALRPRRPGAAWCPASLPGVGGARRATTQVVPAEQSTLATSPRARAAGGDAPSVVVVPGDHFAIIDPDAPSFPSIRR